MCFLIDSHCHLDFSCFDHDRAEILDRCRKLSIDTIVIPGTQASQWQKQIELCHLYPQLRFALGLHPYFLRRFEFSHLVKLTNLLNQYQNTVVALGEIGLDAHIDVDWHDPVKVSLERIFPNLTEGGSIILDDYFAWGGCKKATDEFLTTIEGRYVTDDSQGAMKITKIN